MVSFRALIPLMSDVLASSVSLASTIISKILMSYMLKEYDFLQHILALSAPVYNNITVSIQVSLSSSKAIKSMIFYNIF